MSAPLTAADATSVTERTDGLGSPFPRPLLAWSIVLLLMAAYTLSYVDRQILSLMVGPIRRDLHLNDTQISLLQGLAFALFYSFLGLPFGRMADVTSRVRLISFGVAFWSAMTALCGLSHNFFSLFLARIGVGAGEAVLSPAAYSLIHDIFPKRRAGLALSLYVLGISLGGGLALVIGAQMVQAVQNHPPIIAPVLGEMYAWQFIFFYLGLPGVLMALLILVIREPRRRGLVDASQKVVWMDLWRYLFQQRALVFCHFGAVSVMALLAYARGGWGPTYYIRDVGWSVGQTGLWLGISSLVGGILGAVYGGWYADRWVARGVQDAAMRIIAICAVGVPLTTILAFLIPNPWVDLAFYTLGGFFGSAYGGVSAGVVQQTAPARLRGQMAALLLMSQSLIGLVFGPLSVALLTDYVFKNPAAVGWSMCIVCCLTGPLGVILSVRGLPAYRRALAEADMRTLSVD